MEISERRDSSECVLPPNEIVSLTHSENLDCDVDHDDDDDDVWT